MGSLLDLSDMVATVVDKLLRSDVLDEQATLQVREKLNRGRSSAEALYLAGVAEERPLRFIAEVLGLAYVELFNQHIEGMKSAIDRNELPTSLPRAR